MDPVSSWKAHLSFSDRMSTTLKISTAFQAAFPDSSTSEARGEARKVEDEVLQKASTRDEYENSIQNTIADYLRMAPEDVIHEAEYPRMMAQEPGPSSLFGSYKDCTYHRSGLFSTIYRGKHIGRPSSKRLCAIKLTTPSTEQPPHNSEREARLVRMAAHANVVNLLEGEKLPDGRFAMGFDWIPQTLEELLNSGTPLDLSSILSDLFRGLAHIHSMEILHRDLKPSNLLLAKRPHPYTQAYDLFIGDFGIAWHADDQASEPADAKITDIGTTCYRAPELLFGCRNYKAGVDLWSAGCVMAEIVMHDVWVRGGQDVKAGWTLFDAGELGSDLALIKSIFETLGTPDEKRWPETKSLPDWGKFNYKVYPAKAWIDILPGDDNVYRDIVAKLVQYQSSDRISAQKVYDMLAN